MTDGRERVRSVLSKIRIGIFLLSPSTHLCANIHLTSHVPVNRDAQRELTTGLDVGAAYVKIYMAGFSFGIGGGHTPLPLSCCTTLLVIINI